MKADDSLVFHAKLAIDHASANATTPAARKSMMADLAAHCQKMSTYTPPVKLAEPEPAIEAPVAAPPPPPGMSRSRQQLEAKAAAKPAPAAVSEPKATKPRK